MRATVDRFLVITIEVAGSPAPQGSKRHVGNGRMTESSKHVKPWRDAVRADAILARQSLSHGNGSWVPLDEALVVDMVFTVPKPAAAPKRRRTWPMRLPDLSKLARSTEDALTDAGIWRDDARVVEYGRLAKVFPGEDPDALPSPGALIRIYRMAELPTPGGIWGDGDNRLQCPSCGRRVPVIDGRLATHLRHPSTPTDNCDGGDPALLLPVDNAGVPAAKR